MESKQTLLFRLYQILCEYSDEEHPLTQQHIIELLERDFGLVVERKAVGRNMSYLKEMGYNIRSDKSGSYIEDRPFENSELRILIDSVLGSNHISAVHSKQLIDKLIAAGGHNFRWTIRRTMASSTYMFPACMRVKKPPCIICQTIRAIFIVQNLIICRVLYVSSERRLRWWSQLFVPYANPPRVRKVKPLNDTKIHERLSLRGLICLTKE